MMIDELLAEVRATLADNGEVPGDDENLIAWGLDSIALMRLASQWCRNGIEVSFGALAAQPTIGAWRSILAAAVPAPVVSLENSAPSSFPLAPLQHAYWVGRQDGQQLGGVAAHLYTEFDGPELDVSRLERAVRAVVRRHPMLRMAVREDGTQSVRSARDFPLVDVSSDDTELAALRQRRSHQMLDIEHGQVFEVGLTLLPNGRSRLHVDVDMVAADARSYRILLADLARCYAEDADLGDPPDYDFARYLADHRATTAAAVERAAGWWAERLAEQPGAPELPVDQRAADPGRTGRRAKWLSPEVRDRLAERARKHGVTLAMTLATAYAEVVGGWSAQRRFLLNLPLFDREPVHPEVAGLVGDFTSSVLLDVDLRESVGFAERVRRLQAQLHERAERSAFSGVNVLRELTRARGEQVVAPVVFTSALGLGELFDPVVLREFGEPVWIISQGPQVLLDAQVTELHGGVLVNWDVRENLLRPGVADAMFDAFIGLLDGLAGSDTSWAGVVGELLPTSQRAVRERVNDTTIELPVHCLHEPFFVHAARTPDAPALLWGADGVLTYGEVAERALRVAGALWQHGMRVGDTVAVSLPKGPDQVIAVLGVLAAGGTYLPIGRDQPETRLRRIMTIAGAQCTITDRELDEFVVIDPAVALSWPDPLPGPEIGSPSSIAYLLFTSGSTGEPKGVEVPHRVAVNTIEDLVARCGLGAADRALGVSAMEFDLSVFDVFGLLSVGGSVVVVREPERGDARAWAGLVRGRAVTVLNCVPALLDMLLVTGDLGASLRLVLLGGDWVGADLPGRLAAQVPGCRFAGLGGTTETAIHSTWCEVRGEVPADWRSVPYGVPLGNVACRVVDERGRDCPDWVPGEVWIGGSGVAAGYRGDPVRTAAKFLVRDGKRWYRTGDLGRYWPDGTLEFLGRADHQVKLRGYRIELGEVEAALAAQPGVRRAVVRLSERRGGSLQAVVAGEVDESTLRSGLTELVPGYMIPDLIRVLPELPLTRNGKPDRRAIDALLDGHATAVVSAGPSSALERVLLEVWHSILGDDSIGIEDDFLARGGDSVLATRVVAAVREALDTEEIRVRDVFTTRTVTALARRLLQVNPRLAEVAEIAVEISELSEVELERELRG